MTVESILTQILKEKMVSEENDSNYPKELYRLFKFEVRKVN